MLLSRGQRTFLSALAVGVFDGSDPLLTLEELVFARYVCEELRVVLEQVGHVLRVDLLRPERLAGTVTLHEGHSGVYQKEESGQNGRS